jgi:hypothetical protein
LHMQAQVNSSQAYFERFVGLASMKWVGEWWADCHWSCADYYVILPLPRNYTFLLHLTRGKATVNQHPPVHHAGWMDGWMDEWIMCEPKTFFIVSLSGNLSQWQAMY